MKKAAKSAKAAKVAAKAAPAVKENQHRVLTMADYRALEKAAKAIETCCRIRRKYIMAMEGATQCIERNLDKLREIAWGKGVAE